MFILELEDREELDLDNPQLPDLPEDDDDEEEEEDLDLENKEPLLPLLLLLPPLLLLLPPPLLHPPNPNPKPIITMFYSPSQIFLTMNLKKFSLKTNIVSYNPKYKNNMK